MQLDLPHDGRPPTVLSLALVDDDPRVTGLVQALLSQQGWHCQPYARGSDFLSAASQEDFDVVVLDQRLPDCSGLEVLERLSGLRPDPPATLMLTSCADDQTLEAAFEAGAQDFLLKPYRARELIARLKALLRRPRPVATDRPRHGHEGALAPGVRAGWALLTPRERRCAEILLGRLGQTVSRELLRQQVWGLTSSVQTRTVDTHVSRVRTKLGLTPDQGFRLETLYGLGWRLEHHTPSAQAPAPRRIR